MFKDILEVFMQIRARQVLISDVNQNSGAAGDQTLQSAVDCSMLSTVGEENRLLL